jgi:hypothetical protein
VSNLHGLFPSITDLALISIAPLEGTEGITAILINRIKTVKGIQDLGLGKRGRPGASH